MKLADAIGNRDSERDALVEFVSAEREYEDLFSLKESWTLLCLSRCLPSKGDPMAALHEATLRDIRTAAAATIRNSPWSCAVRALMSTSRDVCLKWLPRIDHHGSAAVMAGGRYGRFSRSQRPFSGTHKVGLSLEAAAARVGSDEVRRELSNAKKRVSAVGARGASRRCSEPPPQGPSHRKDTPDSRIFSVVFHVHNQRDRRICATLRRMSALIDRR